MEDALKQFREALNEHKQARENTAAGEANVVQQYAEWVDNTVVPTFTTLVHQINDIEADSEIEAIFVEPYGDPARVGIEVIYPGRPKFVYRLFLHPRTGTERAFVMKERTVENRDWHPTDDPRKKTLIQEASFFDEHNDGRHNHASEITAEDIIKDFQRDYLEYYNRKR